MLLSPLPYLRRYLRKKLSPQVYAGIYKGMRWEDLKGIDCFETKLMGIYEKELYPSIQAFCQKNLQSLTIIGAGEGYHAIGLALNTKLMPVCFEADSHRRENLKTLADLNQIKIDIQDKFENRTTYQPEPGLILMDIEGAEQSILSRDRLESWQKHFIIVEVHSPEIQSILTDKASHFFDVQLIPCQPRSIKDYPLTIPFKRIFKRWWNVPIQEWRSESLGWLICTPRV